MRCVWIVLGGVIGFGAVSASTLPQFLGYLPSYRLSGSLAQETCLSKISAREAAICGLSAPDIKIPEGCDFPDGV